MTIQNNFFKILIGVPACYIVGMLYWGYTNKRFLL